MCHGRRDRPDRAVPSREMASTLHQQFVAVVRRRHLARRTEKAYWMWIMAFLRFHRGSDGWRHPRSMGAAEVEAFLSHLAVERKVAAVAAEEMPAAVPVVGEGLVASEPEDFRGVLGHARHSTRPNPPRSTHLDSRQRRASMRFRTPSKCRCGSRRGRSRNAGRACHALGEARSG